MDLEKYSNRLEEHGYSVAIVLALLLIIALAILAGDFWPTGIAG